MDNYDIFYLSIFKLVKGYLSVCWRRAKQLKVFFRSIHFKTSTMQELVVAVNRMNDRITDLATKVESLAKSSTQQLTSKYVEGNDACAILHVSERTLYKMRSQAELPFISIGRKILYKASDIYEYLENKARERKERFRM